METTLKPSFIVPFTPYEWKYVRQLIRSRAVSDIKKCLVNLATWISRTGNDTPVAIICSHVLLQAVYSELLLKEMCESEQYMAVDDLRSKHGYAIVRFVNYINELGQNDRRLKNMYESCCQFGIPKNIIDVRHAITHQTPPDIAVLRETTDFCLDWLWKNFWLLDSRVAMNSGKAGASSSEAAAMRDLNLQQEREQKYAASLRAFNSWRIKNRGLNEEECAASEVLMALKRHILLDARGFLACFLRDGHLIQTAQQLKNAKLTTSSDASYAIAESTQAFWEPLFHMMFNLKLGADIVIAFLWRLREQKLAPDSSNQIKAYVRMILLQFDDADVFSDQEWAKVFDHLLVVAKQFEPKLVDSVMAHCTKMSSKRRKQVHRILNISSSPRTSTSSDPPMTPGGGVVHTVEDLQRLFKSERKVAAAVGEKAKVGGNGIELCEAENWADVPFGMAPGQRLENFTVVIETSRKRKAFDTTITLEEDD